jgi:hypothetical protein
MGSFEKPRSSKMSFKPEQLDALSTKGESAVERENPACDVLSHFQAETISRLGSGGTFTEDLVNVLIVSTIIPHPFG